MISWHGVEGFVRDMLRYLNRSAPVAQLDRASGYEPEGREFESPRAHHSFPFYSLTVKPQPPSEFASTF
jgi:hypothetical protein